MAFIKNRRVAFHADSDMIWAIPVSGRDLIWRLPLCNFSPMKKGEKTMKEELVNKIIQGMLMILDNAQMSHLLEVLNYALFGYEIHKMEGVEEEDIEQENKRVLNAFIAAKNIEGCSEKSLKYYRATIEAMLMTVKKGVLLHITTGDLREYLTKYQDRTLP